MWSVRMASPSLSSLCSLQAVRSSAEKLLSGERASHHHVFRSGEWSHSPSSLSAIAKAVVVGGGKVARGEEG